MGNQEQESRYKLSFWPRQNAAWYVAVCLPVKTKHVAGLQVVKKYSVQVFVVPQLCSCECGIAWQQLTGFATAQPELSTLPHSEVLFCDAGLPQGSEESPSSGGRCCAQGGARLTCRLTAEVP